MTPRLLLLTLATPLALRQPACAQQQPLGSVALKDVVVTGTASAPTASNTNGQALLVGNATVTAKDHAAEVKLARGGTVEVCSTSGLHLTAGSSSGTGTPPLMLSLDRGAMEIRMEAGSSDIVMTPDLRMAVKQDGRLDLRVRVTPNGDTCVENHSVQRAAPVVTQTAAKTSDSDGNPNTRGMTVNVTSLFGDDSYDLRPGQHVLFEHGDLHQVVDEESSPCGCPAEPPSAIAEGGVFGPGADAAAQHPFPAAISQGLAPPDPVPQAPAGVVHAQVSTSLSYSGDGAAEASLPSATEPPIPFSEVPRAPAPPPPAKPGLFHRLGHFFKRFL
ncbi:MAG TPA: hypothetical protein VNW54_07245 [Granulicella sp.]|jgi:hypothetical protein|nr:hypothetical protein [Granulicella sp.]